MNRLDKQEYSDLKKLTKYLDKIGYYSMLLVYDSGSEDQWIKCASVVSKNQKIKFSNKKLYLASFTYDTLIYFNISSS